ncbi:MAG: DUF370 domain-containing protein [Anaerovibrio sp.]|uniref:extracellular matrix regulator RemB n=1 Tax=Anaerovibrio sp. TaxID=1872532 RepID=UPI0025E4D7C6|nr:extracellular matrix/biofilm biosynthesis regulator RemA family protein [Anaerovibrio sp.]MCR5176069.1 DUF370 domain-containing protein [Anaerovibrio sp.]
MLFLGGNTFISSDKLIGIINYSGSDNSSNDNIIAHNKEKILINDITMGSAPKSIIITDNRIYISAISAITLKNRADFLSDLHG